MNRSLTMCTMSLLTAFLLVPCAAVHAQEAEEVLYLPSARLSEGVREAAAGEEGPVLATFLERRDDHASIMVRRTKSGSPELHEAFDDIYVVQDGAAVLVHGGTCEGARTVEPGELRDGAIRGGTRQPPAPGDVVVVPADVPHQVEVEPGNTFIYHVLKVRRGK